MNVGIVGDSVRQHLAPVQSFGMEAVKPHPISGTTERGQQRGKTSEKFQINYGVNALLTCPD